MTKKDYVTLARAMNQAQPTPTTAPRSMQAGAVQQWEQDVKGIANVLALDNSRFDRERFLTACGLG